MSVFAIFLLLMLLAIAFFHYVQGFLSSTISAVLSILSAVFALAYHETLTEGILGGVAPDWMPALVMLGLYALTYVILRTLFDKLIPGQIQLPAVLDKVGGAAMGLVAGIFGLGVVAVAAQQMPFGTSVGGYVRYETEDRTVTVPTISGSGSFARAKDAATSNEINGDTFDPEKGKKILIPMDDILVGAVAHLSDKGSLSADKPFASVHPDYLTELFGQRIGIQGPAARTLINLPDKNLTGVELLGVYAAPALQPAQIVDHEMKRIRGGTQVKVPGMAPDDVRVVVRVRFTDKAVDSKDKRIRLSPGSVRLVARRPNDTGTGDELVWHNYFPIGTLEANGLMYANKIDDFLIIEPGKKVAGGDTAPEVDFVFQVKREGFVPPKSETDPEPQVEPGVFVEIKKLGRMDLAGDKGKLKSYKPITVLALKRKKLDLEGGPVPPEPGKTAGAAPAPSPTPTPAGAGGGGGVLGQRLVGDWKGGSPLTGGVEILTFSADGNLKVTRGNAITELRWVASSPPQGETLTIKTAPTGTDPATGEQRTIVFEDENQFSMTDGSGNRRFAREGSPGAAAPEQAAPAPEQPKTLDGPNAVISRMTGTWGSPDGMWYNFRADGTYTVTRESQKGEGAWTVEKIDGEYVNIKLVTKGGKESTQRWRLLGVRDNQIVRYDQGEPVEYTRKS